MSNGEWKKLSEKTERIGYKTITTKTYELPDGKVGEYNTWGKVGTHNVAVIALSSEYKVVIARQFRPGPEIMMDEIPGGGANDGEDYEHAARREMREETGYETKEPLISLGINRRDAYMNEMHHYYLATECVPSAEVDRDDNEHIEIVLISIEQLITNARSGLMTDDTAVLMAYDMLKSMQDKTA